MAVPPVLLRPRARYPDAMIRVTPSIVIDESELEFRFVTAQGPGGQNVNRVATAVQLRFDAARSPALSDDVRARLKKAAGRRMRADGVLAIHAQRFRHQERNRADAVDRLVALIRRAASAPRPRRPTVPSRAGIERRLEAKRRRAQTKGRRAIGADE